MSVCFTRLASACLGAFADLGASAGWEETAAPARFRFFKATLVR